MDIKFIHIGCHKCGSTFLQVEVWPKIKGITYFPFSKNHPIFKEMEHTIRCGEIYFELEEIKKIIHEKIGHYKNLSLSHEGFSGLDPAILGSGYQIKNVSERIRQIFGNTKILIVIRNQKKILPSMYLDDIKYGYLMDFTKWIHWKLDICGLNYYKYHSMIKCYIDYFGRENVKVILFEELFNREILLEIFEDFKIDPSGIDDIDFTIRFNEAYSLPSFYIARLINRLSGSKLTYGSIYGPSPVRMYNLWRYKCAPIVDQLSKRLNIPSPKCDFEGYDKLLFELFHEDNKKTAALTGFDLSSYGYV